MSPIVMKPNYNTHSTHRLRRCIFVFVEKKETHSIELQVLKRCQIDFTFVHYLVTLTKPKICLQTNRMEHSLFFNMTREAAFSSVKECN